ncbi:hypothetical protein ACIQXV_06910 [Neobacillus sp. NPDC097160]|uniref:hypothetical protein n=1 Tax=Neobacillus sp. NPDC097160 TaxID=3364298 RepID=UPI0037F2015A
MLKKVKRPTLYGPDNNKDQSEERDNNMMNLANFDEKETDEKTERNFAFNLRRKISNIFPVEALNLYNLLPPSVDTPSISEGVVDLTISDCTLNVETYGKYQGLKKAIIKFFDEEGQVLTQTFYLGQTNTNFVKFINGVLGEIPEGEFSLNTLKGRKIRAFLYHNYTNEGKCYVNIATCEPVE